ncbi:MAG: hypothetical protein A2Y12_04825 [Planctomycetes bacterium GWF2_42_9]|nr:MAG: hypothetical protein A2Y12_04825 [Planctomycetes bacterium GWF2_42_9]
MRRIRVFALVLVGLLISSSQGRTVFQDNFETGVVAVTQPSTADADPVATTGSWAITEQRTGQPDSLVDVQVINNATPGSQGGSNYLAVERNVYAMAHANLSEVIKDAHLTIEADLYVTSNADPYAGARIWVRNGSNTTIGDGTEICSDYFLANGQLRHYTSPTTYTLVDTYAMNQWIHVVYVFDLVSQTYNLTVAGTTYSGLNFANSQTQVVQVTWQGAASGAKFYIDNLTATTDMAGAPEPKVVLFQDNFEYATAVTWPDAATDADPVAQKGAWSEVMEQGGTTGTGADNKIGVQVSNNVSPGPSEGDKYLTVNRITYGWIRGNLASPGGPELVSIEFDVYVTPNASAYAGPRIWIRNATDNSWAGPELSSDLFQANGQLWHYTNSSGARTILGAYAMSTWLHVKYTFNFANQTYDLRVGGTTYAGLGFVTTQDQIKQIAFQGAGAGALFFIDNLAVKTAAIICNTYPRGDFNRDCKVDFLDLAEFTGSWLDCNLDPISLCGQN